MTSICHRNLYSCSIDITQHNLPYLQQEMTVSCDSTARMCKSAEDTSHSMLTRSLLLPFFQNPGTTRGRFRPLNVDGVQGPVQKPLAHTHTGTFLQRAKVSLQTTLPAFCLCTPVPDLSGDTISCPKSIPGQLYSVSQNPTEH